MVDKDKDVISVPYPMKTFNWDKMYANFKDGKIKIKYDPLKRLKGNKSK